LHDGLQPAAGRRTVRRAFLHLRSSAACGHCLLIAGRQNAGLKETTMNKFTTLAIIAALTAPALAVEAAQPVRPTNPQASVSKPIVIDESQTGGHLRGVTIVMQSAPSSDAPIASAPPPSPIALLLPAVQKVREAAARTKTN
jgi:hypothetical protein